LIREQWLHALRTRRRIGARRTGAPLAGVRPDTDEALGLRATRAILWGSLVLPDFAGKWRVVTALQRRLAAGEAGERVVTRQGLNWQLDPTDFPHYDLFWYGYKERWETLHVLNNLTAGATIFDVGANFGYYAIVLASVLGPDARVHAFEPNPPTFARLQKNVALNHCSNIAVHAFGLSDTEGETGIQTRDGNSGVAQLVEGSGVPVRPLDAIAAEAGLDRLDFVKIDVEGFEERVLVGGATSFARFRPLVLIELNPPYLARAGSSVERIAKLFADWSYRLYVPARDKLVPLDKLPTGDNYVNALAAHRDAPIKTAV